MSCYMTELVFVTDCHLKVKLEAIQAKAMHYIHSTQLIKLTCVSIPLKI